MNPDDQRVVQSRKAIIEAAVRVLLNDTGASLSEIAQEAGVGRATLYRHFDTKESLLQALARQCLAETDAAMEPIKAQGLKGRTAIEASVAALMPLADRFRFLLNLWSFTEGDEEVNRIYQRQLSELEHSIEEARSAHEIDRHIPTKWIVAAYDHLLYAAWQMIHQGLMTHEQAGSIFTRTLFEGIGVPEGHKTRPARRGAPPRARA